VTSQKKNMENGRVVMGDLPKNEKKKEWSCCNGWPTQVEEWSNCNGWHTQEKKHGEWSSCNGWPTQKNVSEGSKAHSKGGRVRKCTTWEVRAQRRTRNAVWLENALPGEVRAQRRTQKMKVWGLKGALKKRER